MKKIYVNLNYIAQILLKSHYIIRFNEQFYNNWKLIYWYFRVLRLIFQPLHHKLKCSHLYNYKVMYKPCKYVTIIFFRIFHCVVVHCYILILWAVYIWSWYFLWTYFGSHTTIKESFNSNFSVKTKYYQRIT